MKKLIAASYKSLLRPVLFLFDPEFIHNRFLSVGNLLGKTRLTRDLTSRLFNFEDPVLSQNLFGIEFKNPVGLSAGFDKDAALPKILGAVGFGFGQIGTVTYKPYVGNPRPRLYRLKKSKGIVVYYGLKNEGVSIISSRIKGYGNLDIPLSMSIGK
ncbi:dihydroorotate dehydrogenase (quinone), partial [candidate division WWE3 bacterium]|nr:dihydroorotate dehydrogenase (quinone) [candidate division WWE3 bacterium]